MRDRSLEQLAALSLRDAGISGGPVDLFAVARVRRVHALGLRFIVPRGLLVPVNGGFEAYIRNSNSVDYDTRLPEPLGALTVRQRFSLAHEIAHTFYFDLNPDVPRPIAEFERLVLEQACNSLAAHLLMPTNLLRKDVSDYDCIDAGFTRHLASKYRASLETTLERLTSIQPASPLERCVLVARRVGREAQIRAFYFGLGLRKTIARPTKYSPIREWLPDFPRHALEEASDLEWKSVMAGRSVVFQKTELGGGSAFLLQAQVE